MSSVGVKELKNRLTHYLRRTKQGEEIIVTDRGAPIALLHPINGTAKAMSLEGKLGGLAARGAVILPTRKPLKRVRLVGASGKPVSKVILDEHR
jgi:prevent-host-death family protein